MTEIRVTCATRVLGTLIDLESLPPISLLSPAAPLPLRSFGNANGAHFHFSSHSILHTPSGGGGCKTSTRCTVRTVYHEQARACSMADVCPCSSTQFSIRLFNDLWAAFDGEASHTRKYTGLVEQRISLLRRCVQRLGIPAFSMSVRCKPVATAHGLRR